MKIGFIGLGTMGGPMAGHLIDAGHKLTVLTRHRESAAVAISRGATWGGTPRELAANSEIVFTVLPAPKDIVATMEGPDGLKAGFRPGTVYVDLSTNAPSLVRQISTELAEIGVPMLDAPISGGPKGAASRKLAIWVGGEEAIFERCRPVLEQMGDQVRYLGASGSGSIAKLVHNCANYGIQMVLAECFTLGVKAGVDPAALFGAIRQGSLGRQRAVDRMADQFLPHMFDQPSFALELAHKDISLATALGRESQVPMRFSDMTLAEMTEALNKGWGKRDSRAAMLVQSERAGVEIRVPRDELEAIIKGEPL